MLVQGLFKMVQIRSGIDWWRHMELKSKRRAQTAKKRRNTNHSDKQKKVQYFDKVETQIPMARKKALQVYHTPAATEFAFEPKMVLQLHELQHGNQVRS
jgi:hypothetical protein